MGEAELARLIEDVRRGRQEDGSLELKRQFWDLSVHESRNKFLKCIAGMANAISADSPRRIIVGLSSDGEIHESTLPRDEAEIQGIISAITPKPNVSFKFREPEGKQIVLIEVLPPYDVPYVAKISTANHIWVRKGSSNETASRYDLDHFYKRKKEGRDRVEWEQDLYFRLPIVLPLGLLSLLFLPVIYSGFPMTLMLLVLLALLAWDFKSTKPRPIMGTFVKVLKLLQGFRSKNEELFYKIDFQTPLRRERKGWWLHYSKCWAICPKCQVYSEEVPVIPYRLGRPLVDDLIVGGYCGSVERHHYSFSLDTMTGAPCPEPQVWKINLKKG